MNFSIGGATWKKYSNFFLLIFYNIVNDKKNFHDFFSFDLFKILCSNKIKISIGTFKGIQRFVK